MRSVWSFVAVWCGAVAIALPTFSQEMTGNTIHEECIKPAADAQFFCYGFIIGAIDGLVRGFGTGLAAAQSESSKQDPAYFLFFCTPEGMTNGQRFDVVTAYLARNPQLRHRRAVDLIHEAMLEAFPCK